MKTYAQIQNNIVITVLTPSDENGNELPIEVCYTPEFVATCALIPEGLTVNHGDSYVDGIFGPPLVIPPTPAEVLASQSEKLQRATQLAAAQKVALTERISTLNDAIELEMATPEEEIELPKRVLQLKAWKTYAVLLGRVTSQVGWPPDVVWPVQPTEGMDLTVSATAPQTV